MSHSLSGVRVASPLASSRKRKGFEFSLRIFNLPLFFACFVAPWLGFPLSSLQKTSSTSWRWACLRLLGHLVLQFKFLLAGFPIGDPPAFFLSKILCHTILLDVRQWTCTPSLNMTGPFAVCAVMDNFLS